jgi:hypothetical protein
MKIEYSVREEDLLETQILIAFRSKNLRKQRWLGSISVMAFMLVFLLHSEIRLQSFEPFKIASATAISIFAGGFFFFLISRIWRRYYLNQVRNHFELLTVGAREL